MAFKTISPGFPEIICLIPQEYADNRGLFFESFKASEFGALGLPTQFVQSNRSVSKKGVIRGMHWQNPPFAQGKLVNVLRGAVIDYVVDVRPSSPNFGKWMQVELTAEGKQQLWVPEGFAHGFIALEDNTEVLYQTTKEYNKEAEAGFIYNDPLVNIDWPKMEVKLSEKDLLLPNLKQANNLFN
jgi:dTDP-4-dehydrorhamnose 3,5-epimerase